MMHVLHCSYLIKRGALSIYQIYINESGPFLVSKTGDMGWTNRQLKVSKFMLT